MPNPSITVTIQHLESIVDSCIERRDPHGLFAALYLKVTRTISDGIVQKQFENNERMEYLDVIFAQRYINAYKAHKAGLTTTAAWQSVFAAVENSDLLCIQHLLLGMNAHINLDLGIAAAEVSRGADLNDLESDFNKINDVLINLLDGVQTCINGMSPAMWLVDWLFTQKDEQFAGFSMRAARTYAWRSAQLLHATPEADLPGQINMLDQCASVIGRELIRPRKMLHWLILIVRRFEGRDVAAQIRLIGA